MEAVRAGALLSWHAATSPRLGERESGDRSVVLSSESGLLLAVIDGLGHGREALASAELAEQTLRAHPGESVIALVRRCHERLRGVRGVVMSLAAFNPAERTMTWLGVGNVEGRLVRADPEIAPRCEFLLLRGGVVGGALPPLHASLIPVTPGDTLILATDGVSLPPVHELLLDGSPEAAAQRLLARHGREHDDALVLIGRWTGH
ncbi:MAG TPA: SpoIIE family protein phosphatase [Gemmatimonadales bacterium]|nr:SpoIIE family protein phosphatase [Gemmatimonadales bacterium]